ncbi:MAG: hypothetical protein LBG26_03470 [Treponema sp.]|jgi:hypothetical protein|nr:hypothetical protein [Treponema sp.]
MDITEIQDELLHLEYPNLLPDHDPDIERYYYLRSTGQSRDALAIYQYRLRPRYPDDGFRTWLLRSYRSHDPAFRGLLAKGYRMLGERSLNRIKNIIFYIAEKAESFNEKDVYSTIRTAEDILRFLPQERYEAVAGIDRFHRYAAALNLKERSVAKASELVRAYLTDTLSVVEEERRRRSEADRKAMEQERQRLVKADYDSYLFQKKFGYRPHLIDLSSVVFSEADLARIEIPPFQRLEDQVLAYCIKYWNMVNDPAFERILFLYSRKYGRKNYDVFIAIRRGRMAKRRDDEILASIVSVLITGYYYSIQGDIYLQRSWNAIKNALQNQVQSRPALPPPPQTRMAGRAVLPNKTAGAVKSAKVTKLKIAPGVKPKNTSRIAPKAKTVSKKAVIARPVQPPAPAPVSVRPAVRPPVKVPAGLKPAREQKTTIVAARPLPVPAPVRPASVSVPVIQRPAQPARPAPVTQRPVQPAQPARPAARPVPAPVKPVQPVRPVPAPVTRRPAQPVRPAPLFAPLVPASPPPKPRKQKVFSTSLEKARGSVSDRLKELSGRSYDVYEDRFLAKTRNAIRKVLGAGKGLFFNLPEEAEDLVFGFLRDNYSNPYMNWEDSAERKNLLSMGFDLPSIIPVIDECYRTLSG